MIRPGLPLPTRYIDYGKVFVPNGALDFSTLAYSDAEVARYGPQLFNRGLLFPETSPFATQIGCVSAALLRFEGGYLFTLLQRRREGELSTDPRTDRPFNQVRFVILTREIIEQAFAAQGGLYTSLAQGARDPTARVWLRDYTAGGEQQPWNPLLQRVDPNGPAPEAVRFVVNALATAASKTSEPQPISVPLPDTDLLEKLKLVEAAQYWLLPRLGVLSFALDYVSIQNVHLRLFHLPADAPAPLPPDQIFMPGAADVRLTDDYYGAVSGLPHASLYDEALTGLLTLRLAAADAVSLLAVERQAQPLPGSEAARLYPELAGLGGRRFNLLRRVPRDDLLGLLQQPDLPAELRLDLLQVTFEAAHGLLVLYAPAHLAAPRASREDERVRRLLRASVAKSLETSLDLVAPSEQAELFRELLLARREATATLGPANLSAPLTFAEGQPLLEALFLRRRTSTLALVLQEIVPKDAALFGEALAVLDRATDLKGLLWLWQNAGQRDFKNYCALLERAVQPAWYAELAREAAIWQALLIEGRALARGVPAERTALNNSTEADLGEMEVEPGRLLRALPPALVPFVWQASLATAERDAAFAEWWLFHEALAIPEQLPALWEALQRLPTAALRAAGPKLNYLLGRPAPGLSLLQACTPPGHDEANEALFATVLRAWLAAGFRLPAGDVVLAIEDIVFLIAHLPGSNDILAAIAASPAQAAAVRGLPPDHALHWARATRGDLRRAYRLSGQDTLFQRLIELETPNETLLWHLLVEDEGTDPNVMAWQNYAALVARSRAKIDGLQLPPQSRLRAYVDAASGLQSHDVVQAFHQSQIDVRNVFALLANQRAAPGSTPELTADSLLSLAVFHLQETNPDLRNLAAELLRTGLQQTNISAHLQGLPDNVLAYLRQNFADGHPALAATGHWIEAELSRRNNLYRVETPAKPASPRPRRTNPTPAVAGQATAQPSAVAAETVEPPLSTAPAKAAAAPPPATQPAAAEQDTPAPLLGQVVLPGAAPKARDTAVWLWVALVVLLLLACAIVIGALVWIQSLPAASANGGGMVSLIQQYPVIPQRL